MPELLCLKPVNVDYVRDPIAVQANSGGSLVWKPLKRLRGHSSFVTHLGTVYYGYLIELTRYRLEL